MSQAMRRLTAAIAKIKAIDLHESDPGGRDVWLTEGGASLNT